MHDLALPHSLKEHRSWRLHAPLDHRHQLVRYRHLTLGALGLGALDGQHTPGQAHAILLDGEELGLPCAREGVAKQLIPSRDRP